MALGCDAAALARHSLWKRGVGQQWGHRAMWRRQQQRLRSTIGCYSYICLAKADRVNQTFSARFLRSMLEGIRPPQLISAWYFVSMLTSMLTGKVAPGDLGQLVFAPWQCALSAGGQP